MRGHLVNTTVMQESSKFQTNRDKNAESLDYSSNLAVLWQLSWSLGSPLLLLLAFCWATAASDTANWADSLLYSAYLAWRFNLIGWFVFQVLQDGSAHSAPERIARRSACVPNKRTGLLCG